MKQFPFNHHGSNKICHILLAEDDDDDFYIFNHAILSILNPVQILRTSNGIMFSSMIQGQFKPDVIFLDINMPYKNGITCLKEIRANPLFDQTRVVIYSTSNQEREVDVCYNLEANFYLVKPAEFSLTKLQLKDLFENESFRQNRQPSRDKFVMNYQNVKARKTKTNKLNSTWNYFFFKRLTQD